MSRPTRPVPVRRRRRERPRAAAVFMLVMLASATGFLFAGTGLERGPESEAAASAAHTAAVRIALGNADPREGAPAQRASESELHPLLDGDEAAGLHGTATRIRIERLGIDAEVRPLGIAYRDGRLEFDTPQLEAGQYVGSASPGEPGNLVIAGHVAHRGAQAVFASLPDVVAGDVVEVFSGEKIVRYKIRELRVVAPEATAVMAQTQDARLTLITCFPDRNYQERLVVVGELL